MTTPREVGDGFEVTFADARLRFVTTPGLHRLHRFLVAYFEPQLSWSPVRQGAAGERWVVRARVGPPNAGPMRGTATRVDVDRSGGFLHCTGLARHDGETSRIDLEPSGVSVDVAARHRTVELWAPDEESLLVPCLRVLEDLMTFELERAGWLFVHAAAVVADGRAVLLCGNKGAGKTSGLCTLLASFDVAQLSSDVCVLRRSGDRVIARGWPSFFKVQVATVAGHAALAGHFPAELRYLLADPAGLWDVYDKVPLYPNQAAELFGAPVAASAPVGGVVLPTFDPSSPIGLSALPATDLATALPSFVQGSRHPNHPDWMGLGVVTDAELDATVADVLAGLAEVESFRLRWAPAYEDLLAAVPALRERHRGIAASWAGGQPAGGWPDLPGPAMAPAGAEQGSSR